MADYNPTSDSVEVVLNETAYVVPDYQREYSWGVKMVGTLWDDLLDASLPNYKNRKYLLGTLVVLKHGSKSEVVDGQQRLVTLSLLFRAMKYSLEEILPPDKELAEKIESVITELDEVRGHIKLHHDADDKVFRDIKKYLNTKEISKRTQKTQKNLINNYNRLYERSMSFYKDHKLNDSTKRKNGLEEILKIIKNLKKRAIFIIIPVPSRNDVYTIFQSLNSKNTPLKQTDLIKSHLMAESTKPMRSSISVRWKDMLSGIRANNQDRALYESMLSRGSEIQENRLYEIIREKYKNDNVEEYLDILDTDLGLIKKLDEPKGAPDLKLRYALFCLSKVDARYFRRVAIAAMRKWGDTSKKTISLIDFLVKFFFMYRKICGNDITPLRSSSMRAVVQIQKGCDLAHVYWTILIDDERDVPRERVDQEEFVRKFKEKSKFEKNMALYTLTSLERHYGSKDVQYSLDELQIEHIFPNAPKIKDWPNMKADKNHKQRLGNLTLMTSEWNLALSNHSFKQKMYGGQESNSICYENSGLGLNKRLMKYDKWTSDQMQDRENDLHDEVSKVWDMKCYAEMAKKFED